MRRFVAVIVLGMSVSASAQPAPNPAPPPPPGSDPTTTPTSDPSAEQPTPPPQPQPPQPPPQGYGPPPPGYGYGPPPPPPPPSPPEATGVIARAGIGIGRYTERAQGLLFESNLQPYALVGGEGAFRAGERGVFVVQAQAGLGIDVHMDATSQGDLLQNNRFHQEIYEGALRYRWPSQRTLFFEVGYHFTMQRLHFTDIEDPNGNPVLVDGATEVVMVHAFEGGLGWRTLSADGFTRRIFFAMGLNRGSAENDQVEGEDFSASGMSFNARASWRWPSGFQIEGQLAWRQQNGTAVQNVTVQGMDTQAFWPKNITWFLGAIAGYAF